ncbi:Ctr copper transporter family-domain-containing protein [Mycena belliarum]|uniref:Copper transport protein n=1 Tax=Mycena belliarum TaxID=1033014 RepID=A0AAD6UMQ7_9AGAR|nr:Ctr copper transporter family-domain-containing protein [Mycena belliae]
MDMAMSMSATPTSMAASAATSGAMKMSMGGPGSTCKISMLANWFTIDACFISRDWHIRSTAAYAGSLVGVFFWVVGLEIFRRLAREYDRRIVREYYSRNIDAKVVAPFQPTLGQQAIRSFFYFVQFGAAYMLMLLAMYYNIGILLVIFFGAYVGHFVSSRDTIGHGEAVMKDSCC